MADAEWERLIRMAGERARETEKLGPCRYCGASRLQHMDVVGVGPVCRRRVFTYEPVEDEATTPEGNVAAPKKETP